MYCWWCSVSKLCLAICESMDCSMPASFVLYYLLEFCPNSCPLSQWCHPTTSSSVNPFFSRFQSFPASGSFPMSWLFTSGAKYWSFSFSISRSNEYSELISFRIDWFDLLAVQGTLKSLLQHHSSKASILWCSAFSMVLPSHLCITTGKMYLWLHGSLSVKWCLCFLIGCLVLS